MFITDIQNTEITPYGTSGACLLTFGRLGLVVRTPADCDVIIKAAVAAKLSMNPPEVPPDDRCVCGHLATDHDPLRGHPCEVCECNEYRWMPDEPVSLWHTLTGRALAGNTDGAS